MCLSIPSIITQIDVDNIATVDSMGVRRQVSLDLMDQAVTIGDYVLIHVGFAMTKLDEADALASLELYQQIIDEMDAELAEASSAESTLENEQGG
ncbi:MAG: hydrogenase expression/formation protein HypC [Thiomicrorhabdus sp.]|nr:MAG: hydrogenase expression/formation protein HypC [Thiomicrorhabdus sp.]